MPSLIVTDIHHDYTTPRGTLPILCGCSLTLAAGESLAVIGPSGSGKSTLLSIVASLLVPTSGSVRLGDTEVTTLSATARAAFRRDRVGIVFQDHHLLPQCTALENVLLPLLASGTVGTEGRRRGELLLERVGLADRASHRPAELSGGERQRVAIARAMVREPLLLLADEPTGSLDESHRREVAELLLGLSRDTMLFLVTHDATFAARTTQQYYLSGGVFLTTQSNANSQV